MDTNFEVGFADPKSEYSSYLNSESASSSELGSSKPSKKRPIEFDSEEESEEEEVVEVEEKEKIWSNIEITLRDEAIDRLIHKFQIDSELYQLFIDIIDSLRNDDADRLFDEVKAVLENDLFIRELYNESTSKDNFFFLNHLRTYGVLTHHRLNLCGGKTEKLMSVIKADSYFAKTFNGATSHDSVLRLILGTILVYCISEEDLKRMSHQIGRPETEVWVHGATSPRMFRHLLIQEL